MVSDEELEVQVWRERPDTKRDTEDDLECGPIDNYENTGLRRREGPTMGRTKRGSFGGLKLSIGPFFLFYRTYWSLISSLVAIEDFLGRIQQILRCARMVHGPSEFLSYPTSLSHTLV